MATVYETRRDRLLSTDFGAVLMYPIAVTAWLTGKPNIFAHNYDVAAIRNHMLGEVEEARAEIDAAHNGGTQRKAELELTDVAFLALGLDDTHQLGLDMNEVRRQVNGYGNRSDYFDRLSGAVGNVEVRSLKPDLEHVLSLWLSGLIALPEYNPPHQPIARVVKKDNDNYPDPAFPEVGVNSAGEVTDEALADIGFSHPRRMLRTIRDEMVGPRNLPDREDGLHRQDWQPFLPLITAHAVALNLVGSKNIDLIKQHADMAYANLQSLLIAQRPLPTLPEAA